MFAFPETTFTLSFLSFKYSHCCKSAFKGKKSNEPKMTITYGEKQKDYEYNARKKAENEEIDRILDKVRKSGYTSLTNEEKEKLFDASKK